MANPGAIQEPFDYSRGRNTQYAQLNSETSETEQDRVAELESQGYRREGNFLYAPSVEYTTFAQPKKKQFTKGTYSPVVIELDEQGRIVKETKYRVRVQESSGSWTNFEAVPGETSVYDYERGVIETTTDASKRETFLSTKQKVESEVKQGLRTSEPLVTTQRREAEARLRQERLANLGYGRFETRGERVGSYAGDVQVFPGSKAQKEKYLTNPSYARSFRTRLRVENALERSEKLIQEGYKTGESIILAGRPQNVREISQSELGQNLSSGNYNSDFVGPIQPNAQDRNNLNLRNGGHIDSGGALQGQANKSFFEKQIDFGSKWESGFQKRVNNLLTTSYAVVRQSPFRKDPNQGLTWWEEAGAYGLAAPALIPLAATEGLSLAAYKAQLFGQGLIRKEYRQSAKQELLDATNRVLPSLKESFNPTTPQGFVNLISATAAPSLFKQGISSARSVTFIGKEFVPAEALVEPKVLAGQKTFPSSSKTASALVDEFQNTVFQDAIKQKIPDARGGFSASPNPISLKGGVQAGSSATPGIYIAPSLSKYFLKINPEGGGFKFSLFPSNPRPTAQYMITDVGLIPNEVIIAAERVSGLKLGAGGQRSLAGQPVRLQGGGYSPQAELALLELNKYFGFRNANLKPGGGGAVGDLVKQGEFPGSGKAAISPEFYLGKGEKEALISVNSGLKLRNQGFNWWDRLTGFKQYTKVDGQRVPLRIVDVVPNKSGLKLLQRFEDARTRGLIKETSRYSSGKQPVSVISFSQPVFSEYSEPTLQSETLAPTTEYIAPLSSTRIRPIISRLPYLESRKSQEPYSITRPGRSRSSVPEEIRRQANEIRRMRGETGYIQVGGRSLPPKKGQKPEFDWEYGTGQEQEVFDVVVREAIPRGKKQKPEEVKVSKTPLPYNAATNLGDEYVDETSARSFYLVSRGKKNVVDAPLFFDKYKYRNIKGRSKVNPKAYVERDAYLIDSSGEYRQITAKGLKAIKSKGEVFNFGI